MENTGFIANESTYKVHKFKIKNTEWMVLVVTGKHNYISVSKKSYQRSIGTDFKNFNEAVSHYKNPSIKLELTKIELGI